MDEFKIREGEPLKLKRGTKIVPLISIDLPIEFVEVVAEETKQKTYMKKFVCPQGCQNRQGHVLTVRLTGANTDPGVDCGSCKSQLVEAGDGA